MDASSWLPMERFTRKISIIRHLLASTEGMGRSRHLPKGLVASAEEAGSTRQNRLGNGHGRCNVCTGKKRGFCVGKTKKGKGTKLLVLIDGQGLPLGTFVASASPSDQRLIEPLLKQRILKKQSPRLLYDKAADGDPLRQRLSDAGIELICPHRKNRRKPPLQDGRKLRRYRHRWKIERTISWLGHCRRLLVRHEFHHHLFHGFAQLGCIKLLLKRIFDF